MPVKTVTIASSAADRGRGLRQHVKAFLQRWNENLGAGAPWQARQAATLYEDLEALCAMAEQENASGIVDPALELAVYLCSFVDGDNPPNATQRQGLEQLISQLAAAVAGDSAPRVARGTAPVSVVAPRQVFYLRSDARELAGLATRLGQSGYIVRPFQTRQLLLLALDEVSPDMLLVDEDFIAEVHALTAAALRKRPAHRDPPLCVVLADATDRSRALFAQRAGADAVVAEHDPIVLVAALEKLLVQRHARDFRVLIVEDDRSQAKFCDSILRHCGMITCICEDAKRVGAMLNEFAPDLVLLDMYLPDANGIEIAQRIREQPRHAFLPIVFLTGEHDQNLRFDAIRIGADDFITKPVKPRHLVTAVESRIKRARELRAGQPEQRGERRGILSARDVLVREIQRAAGESRCAALACISVDDADRIASAVGFVAAGTLPQQIASALAVELSDERTLCAWGEMRFLALAQAENTLALRETFEELRRKLDARLWLSDEMPVRLRFSVGCVRIPAETGRIDELLERARALCVKAQQSGGAHCEFELPRDGEQDSDPRRRLLRAVLRAPNIRGLGRLDFQPLLPLSGQITGQYEARMELIPEKFANALRLKRSDYLPLARDLGLADQADRQCLRALLGRVQDGRADKHALRLHVPVCGETAFDSAFAPWLAAELRGHRASGGLLVLVLTAAEVHARLAQAQSALEPLQRLGLRLGVQLQETDRHLGHELLQVEAIHVVRFVRPEGKAEEAWGRYSSLFNEARSLGKTVLASGVQRMEELAVLMRLGVHYVQGDVLGSWSADWNFDFAVVA